MGRNRSPRLKARVLVERDGRILLVRHAKRKQRAFWCLPGGNADPGESIAQAARRELLEETGVDVVLEGAVMILDGPDVYIGDGGAVEVILRGQIAAGEPGPTDHAGDPYLDRVAWRPADDLPSSFRPAALAALLAAAGSAAALPLIPLASWGAED
jgi:ADP-ribose pyrophosphatase YjhB (NUDIX family)